MSALDNLKAQWQQAVMPHWTRLADREKVLVSSALVLLAIALVYFILWRPLAVGIEERQLQLAGQQQTLQWVREQAGQLQALQNGSTDAARTTSMSGSLTQRVTQLATTNQVAVTRIQPQGDGLLVVVDEVSFTQLLIFIGMLESNAGAVIEALDIAAADTPGMVRVRKLQVRD